MPLGVNLVFGAFNSRLTGAARRQESQRVEARDLRTEEAANVAFIRLKGLCDVQPLTPCRPDRLPPPTRRNEKDMPLTARDCGDKEALCSTFLSGRSKPHRLNRPAPAFAFPASMGSSRFKPMLRYKQLWAGEAAFCTAKHLFAARLPQEIGIERRVLDPAGIQVNRRAAGSGLTASAFWHFCGP